LSNEKRKLMKYEYKDLSSVKILIIFFHTRNNYEKFEMVLIWKNRGINVYGGKSVMTTPDRS
jgi:hypothetical protein